MDNGIAKICRLHLVVFLLATAVPNFATCYAQSIKVISKIGKYKNKALQDSSYKMVELKSIMPLIVYDLRYATKNNFTGQKLYKRGNKTFLRTETAEALRQVQTELLKNDLNLKVYDAYRPYAATKLMWELIKDERYVANPVKGSGHNRGLAIDLTIIDNRSGKELDMGTGFDNFTDTAHQTFTQLPVEILNNRKILKQAMEKAGFKALETEWWHYYWPNNKNYDVLDIDFKKF